MIYRAINRKDGSVYICPAQMETGSEYPPTQLQLIILELDDDLTHYKAEAESLEVEKQMFKDAFCESKDKNYDLQKELSAMTALAEKYRGQRDELMHRCNDIFALKYYVISLNDFITRIQEAEDEKQDI